MKKHIRSISFLYVVVMLCVLLSSCDTVIPKETVGVVDTEPKITEDIGVQKDITDVMPPEIAPDLLDTLTVEFIDVGQGDSCLIITPHNDVILIDTGDAKDAKEIKMALEKYAFENIDLMVLSHPHADHINGAETVLDDYDVVEVLMSSYVATTKTFDSLLDAMTAEGCIVTPAQVGCIYDIDGVKVEVLGTDIIHNDCNNSSVVAKVSYGDIDMLFTGDLESKGEQILVDSGVDLTAEVLKVGHHGSDTSSSSYFLQAITPKVAVISVGDGNKYGHPSSDTLQRLLDNSATVYRTDEVGSVIFEIDGKNILCSSEKVLGVLNEKKYNRNNEIHEIASAKLEVESVVVMAQQKEN